jgi:hypothetical protein
VFSAFASMLFLLCYDLSGKPSKYNLESHAE